MSREKELRTVVLCALAMLAFAGNSLLCRTALASRTIDPASFALLRTVSGAVLLSALVLVDRRPRALRIGGSLAGAIALTVYMCGFAFAYLGMGAGTGALLLFGSVQITMLGWAVKRGERPSVLQGIGMLCAVGGLVRLVAHGLSAPPLPAALSMIAAGVAWAVYTLLGRSGGNPRFETAGNFLRASVLCVPVAILAWLVNGIALGVQGALLAIASGAVASGLGYAIWYAALPGLTRMRAAIVQLTVPVLTALLGVLLLDEMLGRDLLLAMVLVLGGVAAQFTVRRG